MAHTNHMLPILKSTVAKCLGFHFIWEAGGGKPELGLYWGEGGAFGEGHSPPCAPLEVN